MNQREETKQASGDPSLRTVLKIIGLVVCLVVPKFVEWVLYALAQNGCTKYVPRGAVLNLIEFAWQLWSASAAVSAIIFALFLSGFLRRPRSLVSRQVLPVTACFAIWQAFSLAEYVRHTSRCGEAREVIYPERYPEPQLAWVNPDFLFWGAVAASFATIAAAAVAIAREDEKRWLRDSGT